MRPVLLLGLARKIPNDWLTGARAADDASVAAAPGERAKTINNNRTVWSDLKDLLRDYSHGKCWYCESIDDRSDNAVDHFRPKNHVKESPDKDNEGYWWLAFEWKNYRFSCTFCNSARRTVTTSGGKQDRFPLKYESKRARKREDPLAEESPVLLDPTEAADCFLVTFDKDGMAVPVVSKEENPYEYERAATSIEVYHLNQPAIVDRRAVLISAILYALERADELRRKDDHTAYRERVNEIHAMQTPESQYSQAARAAIGSQRGRSRTAKDFP